MLYIDDLVIKAEYIEELLVKLDAWKEKDQHVNIKYEFMKSAHLSLSAPYACGTNYSMMEDGGDSA